MHTLSTAEESEYFQRAARFPDLHDAGRLMIELGQRQTEILALAKNDVDLDRDWLQIHSAEGNRSRIVLITAEARQILIRRMVGDSPWIFPSKRNSAEHTVRVSAAHRSVVAEAAREGIIFEFTLRDLRETCYRRMLCVWANRSEVEPPVVLCSLNTGHLRRLLSGLQDGKLASQVEVAKTNKKRSRSVR